MPDFSSIINYDHSFLVEQAIEILKALGYDEIQTEYKIDMPPEIRKYRKSLIIDVFGRNKEGKTIAIECGNLGKVGHEMCGEITKYRRIMLINLLFDKFLYFPYFNVKSISEEEIMNNFKKLSIEKQNLEECIKKLRKELENLENKKDDMELEIGKNNTVILKKVEVKKVVE